VQKRTGLAREHVGEGMPLYELIATDPIKLRAPIPERFVPMAKLGIRSTSPSMRDPTKFFMAL